MINEIGIMVLSGFLIFVGVIGAIVPIIPGSPLAYAGLLLYGYIVGFEELSISILVILGILTLLTMLVDLFAPMLGAQAYKSSHLGTLGALLGVVFGFVFLGPLGIIIGPFIGAFAGEYLAVPNAKRAFRTLRGVFAGLVMGAMLKLIVSLSIATYFVVSLF